MWYNKFYEPQSTNILENFNFYNSSKIHIFPDKHAGKHGARVKYLIGGKKDITISMPILYGRTSVTLDDIMLNSAVQVSPKLKSHVNDHKRYLAGFIMHYHPILVEYLNKPTNADVVKLLNDAIDEYTSNVADGDNETTIMNFKPKVKL